MRPDRTNHVDGGSRPRTLASGRAWAGRVQPQVHAGGDLDPHGPQTQRAVQYQDCARPRRLGRRRPLPPSVGRAPPTAARASPAMPTHWAWPSATGSWLTIYHPAALCGDSERPVILPALVDWRRSEYADSYISVVRFVRAILPAPPVPLPPRLDAFIHRRAHRSVGARRPAFLCRKQKMSKIWLLSNLDAFDWAEICL